MLRRVQIPKNHPGPDVDGPGPSRTFGFYHQDLFSSKRSRMLQDTLIWISKRSLRQRWGQRYDKFILQIRRLRPREVKRLAQGHTARKRQIQDCNPRLPDPRPGAHGLRRVSQPDVKICLKLHGAVWPPRTMCGYLRWLNQVKWNWQLPSCAGDMWPASPAGRHPYRTFPTSHRPGAFDW